MANYTIELKDVIEHGYNIFDFAYPFYNDDKKPAFEQSFIRHFYFREIGCDTVDRFKLYLKDKMLTVFPYYNELFKTALIEYDKLNNYNLTDKTVRTLENTGKNAGFSSTVGQLFDEQNSEGKQNRTTDTNGKTTATGKGTETEKTNTKTTATGETSGTSKSDETVTDEKTGNIKLTVNREKHDEGTQTGVNTTTNIKRFLDTPMGKLDISDNNYLTNLTDTSDNVNSQNTHSMTTTDTDTENTDTTENGSSHKDATGETAGTSKDESNSDTSRNLNRSNDESTTATGKETAEESATAKTSQEQKTTFDNNTRNESASKETETTEFFRIGNIGVQTGSDMLQKHIDLQKTLKNIERLFFDECEDLFMLVY